jgi:endoglucanase
MKISWVAAVVLLTTAPGMGDGVRFAGVNLAGGEFTDSQLPGTYGQHYIYPTTAEVDYFMSKGMNIIRLPFLWERLQRSTNALFDATELSRIQTLVGHTTSKGGYILLDVHNYAHYYRTNAIGSPQLPISTFTNLWGRLGVIFRNHPQVIFGLMNEPRDMPTELWRDAANAAIQIIRQVGATNLIFVPGNGYSIAHDWYSGWYGTPNAIVMLGINDPINNFAFEVHDYYDDQSANRDCAPGVGIDGLTQFTAWCRSYGFRGFYGEFGVSTNTGCLVATSNMLAYVNTNADVWLGWSYWAAGPWWGDYGFSIEPINGVDRPQTGVLQNGIPIPQPRLTTRRVPTRNDTAFSFPTRYGFRYQPQGASSLDPPLWTNYGSAFVGNSQTFSILMRSTSNVHGFFRLQVNRLP